MIMISATAQASAYTLLQSLPITPKENLNCNLSILLNIEKAEITVIRLDARGNKFDVNAFHRSPNAFKTFGRKYDLRSLFPKLNLNDLKNVQAQFDFKKGQVMNVKAFSHSGQSISAQADISDFMQPAEKHCLLRDRK